MSTQTVGSVKVLHRPNKRPDHAEPLSPSRTVLKPGHRRTERSRAIEVETILERDQVLTMRDNVTLRADIFRPVTDDKVPAIIMYGPYGKSGSGWLNLDKFPFRVGIPEARLSGYENFEGLDPAEWVPKKYAIVNVDARGIGDSEGDVRWWGPGEGEDGHDTVEGVAKLPWCSGKVSMAGNSWLACSQWFTAAERPPHLACIAPMEGISDALREHMCRGGIPNTRFTAPLSESFIGRGEREDMPAMVERYPGANEYWDARRARIHDIQVPSYIVASFSTGLHTVGSFRGFEEMASKEKWLSVHATQEWYDLYTEDRTEDLQRFFDRYLKEIDNGWEATPRVRYSFIRFNKHALVNVPFPELPWDLASAKRKRLFLSADGQLSPAKLVQPGQVKYQADAPSRLEGPDPGDASFAYVFPQDTRIAGPCTAILFLSAPSASDMDVFIQLRKADRHGNPVAHSNIPMKDIGVSTISDVPEHNVMKHLGPQGMLRASQRHVSEALSSSSTSWRTLSHNRPQPVTPGEVVRLEIQSWPTGMAFDAGEQLLLYVSGHYMVLPEFDTMPPYVNHNRGEHVIHVGGECGSSLLFYEV